MVEDLCFHMVDLVQNSAAAGARNIALSVRVAKTVGRLTLEVADDGRGMDGPTLLKVQDPFFTSKSFKRVGLGIPLLKASAEACRGNFRISSRLGRGTRVRAQLLQSHIDCPPLGDLEETLLTLLVSLESLNLRFTYRSGREKFSISSADIRRQVGDLHFSHPEVQRFLKDYIHEGLGRLISPSG
jgi:hypothetical protein